jgi:hypothetical protein
MDRRARMRLISVVALVSVLSAMLISAGEPLSSPCLMQPPARAMQLDKSGFTWQAGGGLTGPCDRVPSDGWSRKSTGSWDLHVHADGPEGSGRFWTVTVGVSRKQETKPVRGVCLSTSTVGWRTLQRYSKGALPWLDDLNNDGGAELILWASFPLRDEASMAEYGLVAWVYRLDSPDSLSLDWDLSRRLARSLAKEYRSPLDHDSGYPSELRARAAEALERFAEERCNVAR